MLFLFLLLFFRLLGNLFVEIKINDLAVAVAAAKAHF